MKKRDVFLGGGLVLALGVAVPLEADAALRYRVDGHECMPAVGTHVVGGDAEIGPILQVGDLGEDTNTLVCSIPLGSDLVELDNTNSRQLDKVSLRLRGVDSTSQTCQTRGVLTTHDFDSNDFEDCDDTAMQVCSGYCLKTLNFSTSCGSSDWAATVTARADWSRCSSMEIKLISVYDT